MGKIAAFINNGKQVNFTLAWFIRVAILLLLVRLTFFAPQKIYITEPRDPLADSIAVLKFQITELQKRDSIIVYNEKQIIDNIGTMHIDTVASIIAKHIRQRQMLHAK
jgi:hypothetical protein